MMKPQVSPAVPPFIKPTFNILSTLDMSGSCKDTYVKITSQVAIRVQANPSMEMNLKFLYHGCY